MCEQAQASLLEWWGEGNQDATTRQVGDTTLDQASPFEPLYTFICMGDSGETRTAQYSLVQISDPYIINQKKVIV